MKSLYESIMDVDDNIENVDSSLLIGGHYYIDVKDISGSHLKDVFKVGLIKMKQPREIIKGPEINSYDDPKENKMVETLCTFILNLPEKCIYDEHDSLIELSPYVDPFIKKLPISNAYIRKNGAGEFVFTLYSNKFMTMYDSQGVPHRDQPRISIFLKKK